VSDAVNECFVLLSQIGHQASDCAHGCWLCAEGAKKVSMPVWSWLFYMQRVEL